MCLGLWLLGLIPAPHKPGCKPLNAGAPYTGAPAKRAHQRLFTNYRLEMILAFGWLRSRPGYCWPIINCSFACCKSADAGKFGSAASMLVSYGALSHVCTLGGVFRTRRHPRPTRITLPMTARASCCVVHQPLTALAQARCALLSLHRHSRGSGWTSRPDLAVDRCACG
jgi:hypothetical protein